MLELEIIKFVGLVTIGIVIGVYITTQIEKRL